MSNAGLDVSTPACWIDSPALALVARNLNDETRGYQETDAGTPRFTVGREVLLLISVDLERAWRNRGLFD